MIEDVSKEIKASDVEHHIVHFYEKDGTLQYQFANIREDSYMQEQKDLVLREKLQETVQGELMAHLKYLMFADRAQRRGMGRVANLFRALAASEYYHARNFYAVLQSPKAFAESVPSFLPGEQFEAAHFYRMMGDYAKEHQKPLARYAYEGAAAAEKEHAKLLHAAEDMDGFKENEIYVCPICGYVMSGETMPDRCPICGGPNKQFETFA